MAKDDRSPVNPFTGKQHYDAVNDDEFLNMCYNIYYKDVNNSELLDDTSNGQMVFYVASKLIKTVEEFLVKIGRYDYVDGYYEWEFHLSKNPEINAYCVAGGKIMVYSGLFQIVDNEEKLAFILAHELAHALLDHGRTAYSIQQTKNTLTTASWVGSFALDLLGFQNAGTMARAAVRVADVGSHFFLTKPWGRDQEYEADKLGMILIHLAGYDVSIVPDFWAEHTGDANTFDFFSTHPSDDKRIAVMRESLDDILNEDDFYSKPVLPETPSPKEEYKTGNAGGSVGEIPMQTSQPLPASAAFSSSSRNTQNTCSHCGSVVAPTAKFCITCGSKIKKVNPLACPECGYITNRGDNFCKSCGYRLTEKLTCSKCGVEVSQSQSFCVKCGNKLK